MILGGGKLKLRGGNPPFPRVLYETLAGLCVCVCVCTLYLCSDQQPVYRSCRQGYLCVCTHYVCALSPLTGDLFTGLVGRAFCVCECVCVCVCVYIMSVL